MAIVKTKAQSQNINSEVEIDSVPRENGYKKAERINLSAYLSQKSSLQPFMCWIVGDTPLITHAWSEKARREMLSKQVKSFKGGKEAKNPEENFRSSLYEMGQDVYGFPAMGLKNAILDAAHKDKGVARTVVMRALWIDADLVRVAPALPGAVCDMHLVRIHGSAPECREDMVRIGSGLNKVSDLSYRGQFKNWAIRLCGNFNSDVLTVEQLLFLIQEAGVGTGIGEWRNEKKGTFGAFHPAFESEHEAWEAFATGKGPLPISNKISAMAAE